MTAGFTYAGYALGVAVLAGLEVWGRRTGSLTFEVLVDRLVKGRLLRALLFLAWAWTGWHLFVRGTAAYLH